MRFTNFSHPLLLSYSLSYTVRQASNRVKTMKAVGYVRVSTEEQATQGVSLEAQTGLVLATEKFWSLRSSVLPKVIETV
jgi:hypothetical protein